MREADVDGLALAAAVGVAPGTISRYLSGTNEPSFENMDKSAKALGKPVFWFFKDPSDPDESGVTLDQALLMISDALTEVKTKNKS